MCVYHISMAQEFLRQRMQATYCPQVVVPVDPDRVELNETAQGMIRTAAAEVAQAAGVELAALAEHLFQYMYRLEPSLVLVLVVTMPGRSAEMVVEIPPRLWRPSDVSAKG